MRVEALALQLSADFSHHPPHQRENNDGEDGKLPTGVEQHAEIAEEKYRVFDEHFERPRDGVLNLVDVTAHAGNDVSLALIRKEAQGKVGDFMINMRADITNDAGAHRHQHTCRSKIARRFQKGGRHKEQTNQEQGG